MEEHRRKVDTSVDLEGLFHLLSRMTGVLVFKLKSALQSKNAFASVQSVCFVFKVTNSPTSS